MSIHIRRPSAPPTVRSNSMTRCHPARHRQHAGHHTGARANTWCLLIHAVSGSPLSVFYRGVRALYRGLGPITGTAAAHDWGVRSSLKGGQLPIMWGSVVPYREVRSPLWGGWVPIVGGSGAHRRGEGLVPPRTRLFHSLARVVIDSQCCQSRLSALTLGILNVAPLHLNVATLDSQWCHSR